MTAASVRESRLRIPLRWRDMDSLGHLNQAVYHELLEESRAALFEALLEEQGFPFVLAHIELDFKHEVRREDGHVEVVARVDRIGRTSVTLEHEVLVGEGTVAAAGRSVLVAFDTDARRPREVSEAERAALSPSA